VNKLPLILLLPATMGFGTGASFGAMRLTDTDLAGIHAGDVGTGNGNGNGNVGNFNGNGNSGNGNGNGNLGTNNGNGNAGSNNGNGNVGNGQGNGNAGDNRGNGPAAGSISAPAPAVTTTTGVSAAAVVASPTVAAPAVPAPPAATPTPVVNLQGVLQGIPVPILGGINLAGPNLSGIVPPSVLTMPGNPAIPLK